MSVPPLWLRGIRKQSRYKEAPSLGPARQRSGIPLARAAVQTSSLTVLITAAFFWGGTGAGSFALADDFKVEKAKSAEQQERNVDEVALAAQENAISKLQGLLKK